MKAGRSHGLQPLERRGDQSKVLRAFDPVMGEAPGDTFARP
jgi:hypothetical protein